MSAPLLIGLTELDQQPWADVGALLLAHAWASFGYRVVLIDGDPASAMLSGWTHTLPDDGPALTTLLRDWAAGVVCTPATDAVLALLRDEAVSGEIGVMRASDHGPEDRDLAPTARAVRAARRALLRAFVSDERADIVLVRLPPLSTHLGVTFAANLVDVLVPMVPPTAEALHRADAALSQAQSLRGADQLVIPVELSAAGVWRREQTEALWLHHLRLVPALRVRPPGDIAGRPLASLVEDMQAIADAVRLQTRLAHPNPTEQVWESDALDDGPGAYSGFMRLLREHPAEALDFFKKSLATNGATRRSAVEALRAMVDYGQLSEERIAWAFRYAVQRFRPAEPDPLSAYMVEVGRRLLEGVREEVIHARRTRVLIDVASALVQHVVYLNKLERPVGELPREAELLLLEAAGDASEAEGPEAVGDLMWLAVVLSRHAYVVGHTRHAELAMDLIQIGMSKGRAIEQAQRAALDVLWSFQTAALDPVVWAKHKALAESMLKTDPGYAHYNLIAVWAFAGDKEQASEHFRLLGVVDPARFMLALKDPTLKEFYLGIGTPEFFNAVPMKDDL